LEEQLYKCEFWKTNDFYGVDLSVLHEDSV